MTEDESHLGNTISGVLLGAVAGGGIGLGACMFIFDEPPLLMGDTVLVGAAICGLLGFFLGEGFIEWLKENCSHFW